MILTNEANKSKEGKMRFKVIRFYWDSVNRGAQYALEDRKRKDTMRDHLGYTQVMPKGQASWLARELNQREVKE